MGVTLDYGPMVDGVTALESEGQILPEEIRAQLERILASEIFRSAQQLSAFLTYVVEQTLSGRAAELKGYTIAVEAFGRSPDFDPQADPIVRVEAGRLRKALHLYYAGEGGDDPVRITVPVGGYVPSFTRLAPPPPVLPSRAPRSPWIAEPPDPALRRSQLWRYAVAPALLLALGALGWHFVHTHPEKPESTVPTLEAQIATAPAGAAVLSEPMPGALPVVSVVIAEGNDPALLETTRTFMRHLVDTMARFDDLAVIKSPAESAAKPEEGADYVLALSAMRSGDMVEGFTRLSSAKDGRIVWTSSSERHSTRGGAPSQLRDRAQRLAIRVAQPFGILHADLRLASASPALACLYQALGFRRQMKPEQHLAARNCLEALVARDPEFHPAWSQLALLAVDEYASGFNPKPGPALDRGLAAAVHAIRLAPSSARAYQALMEVQFLRGSTEEAIRTGREALARNPYDPDIMADLGARYVQLDRPAEGLPLLQRAVELSAGRPAWYDFYLFLAAYLTGNVQLVQSHAALILAEATPTALLGRAIACALADDRPGQQEAMRLLRQTQPLFGEDPGGYLARRGFSLPVRERILGLIGLAPPK
jgi:tetratricopeptide (TPR) repeat protein